MINSMTKLAIGLALAGCAGAALAQTSPSPAVAAAQPAAAPSAETLALARRVAAHDDFLGLVAAMGAGQIAGVEHSLGELTPDEQAKVRAIGAAKMTEAEDRIIDAMAKVYAAKFSPEELKVTATFLETPAGGDYSRRLILILPGLGESMKGFDFKRAMLEDTCAQIKKGCPAAK